MSSIRVTRGGDVFRLPCNDTDTLLALLRRAGCTLPAACGGHGRCGKCRVSVNGVPRLACRVVPEDGDEIVLPPAAGGRILTETLDPPAVPTGETGCAAAIDLGTTTTALRLYDLATGHALATCADWTALAPYGADVITRIQYTIDHQDGLTRLSSLLRQQLKALLTRALSQAGRQPAELKRTVTAGNTVMQSLLAGVSVRPLAAAPFCPETFFRQSSGLTLLDTPLYCVPCAAGFVGGDITAGLLASGLARRAGHFLFLDIGTNGEMALGGMDGFTCCAVAAGPAFEGAGIACGMLGVDGAVSRVRYSGAFKMNVIGGGEAVGLCGSGLIDLTALLLRLGVIDEGGRLLPPEDAPEAFRRYLTRDENGCGVFHLTDRVYLTAADVRALQLAKAAVAAGVLFYAGLILFHGRAALLALQLFNAIFIGIIAGIGMLWFQDLMPGRAGAATTLFTNSISTGVILAGVMQGALSQSYGHASVYWTIAAISLVTLFLTSKVKDI